MPGRGPRSAMRLSVRERNYVSPFDAGYAQPDSQNQPASYMNSHIHPQDHPSLVL